MSELTKITPATAPVGATANIDTGDTVRHSPTGETWIVACVQGEDLSWLGWPEGMAKLSDCELVQKATAEERQELLERMAAMSGIDHRIRYARRILSPSPNTQAAINKGLDTLSTTVDRAGELLRAAGVGDLTGE